jgi:two-component system, NarL family, sensor histidine kinase UhpB
MKTKTKILIVEHDPVDLELLHLELKKGLVNYVSEVVQTEKDYGSALKKFIPDIILSDYTLPSFSGLIAFKIREDIAPDTPFIFVSGTIGEEKSIELIKNGVTDYALKDKLYTLSPKLIRALKESAEKQEKIKAEQERIQSERRLARAQQLARMGSWELDFATNHIHWSDETCSIYGFPPDQNLHTLENWLSFTHPEDLDFVMQKIKEALESLHNFSISYRIGQKDGLIRHIYSECKIEFNTKGMPTGLYGITHDVTERVLLENKLVSERLTRQKEITNAVLTAQENERAMIGKELHDNLNQILAVAKLYIQMARTYEKDREMYLGKSCGFIEDVIGEIRKISKTLVIPGTHIIGLFDNIKNLVQDLTMIHPIIIEFHKEGINIEDIDEKLQLTIFRIVQEQVNNILKHANAANASINLSRKDDDVVLLITDNGEGNDMLKEMNGVGIINIKSRADLYDGKVTIITKPGKGYELKVVLPLYELINKPGLLMVMPEL